MNRRDFLRAGPVIGSVGFAGCGTPSDDTEPPDTQTATADEDESEDETSSDQAEFEYHALSGQPTNPLVDEPVTITVEIENTGNVTGEKLIEVTIEGESRSTREVEIEPKERKVTSFEVTFEDPGEHVVSVGQLRETLNPDLDIGVVYIPFMGGPESKWPDCAVGTSKLGEYSQEDDEFDEEGREVTNTHITQMTDHRIGRVMYNFGEESEDHTRIKNFLDTERSSEIDLECFHVMHQALVRGRDMDADFEVVRDVMYSEPNYSTIDGRPIVTFWWMKTAILDDTFRMDIEEEYGSFVGFVEYLRNQLRKNGIDPFLVADLDDMAYDGYWEGHLELIKEFDGVTNWIGGGLPSGEVLNWDDRLDRMENIYRHNAELTETIGVDHIPTIFPGFDDRENDCWGENRYLPRSQEGFDNLLELANEYRTVNRINIATWNGWNEGHQIEPGSHMGEEYGTDYLSLIKEFQQSGN